MPKPIEILLDPIAWVVLAMYAGLMLWERIALAGLLVYEVGAVTAS